MKSDVTLGDAFKQSHHRNNNETIDESVEESPSDELQQMHKLI
jgi:hypothetical protein